MNRTSGTCEAIPNIHIHFIGVSEKKEVGAENFPTLTRDMHL